MVTEIEQLKKTAKVRMGKSLDALKSAFAKIRTGRANPALLDSVRVSYYGNDTPLSQIASINAEEARTLVVRVWERNMVPEVEKAILKSDLGLNPSTSGEVIRVPLPPLTEETRRGYTKQARQEAESARVSVRNVRRDLLQQIKNLHKEKVLTDDTEREANDSIQKITDKMILEVDNLLRVKENDLMIL